MTRQNWQRLEKSLGFAALCSFLTFWVLQFWFWKMSPRVADLAAVNPLNFHGTQVYLTNIEQLWSDSLLYGGAALFLAAIAIDVWIKPFRK
jgi:hypothetical protein